MSEKKTSDSPRIYAAMTEIMNAIGAVSKGHKNQEQGFVYRSIDDVMQEVHDAMAKAGVFVVPETLEVKDDPYVTAKGSTWQHVKATIKYTFYAVDGSSVSAVVRGEGRDSGDKGGNKALAIALKYVLTQVFMIPTQEDKDPDGRTAPEAVPSTTEMPRLVPRSTTAQPKASQSTSATQTTPPPSQDKGTKKDAPVTQTVKGIVMKTASKKTSKGSIRWGIQVDGEWFNTFDDAIGSAAKEQDEVTFSFRQTQYGKDIDDKTWVWLHHAGGDGAQAQQPDEIPF